MRTTLEIDDRVLAAARAIAEQQNVSIGRAISDLAERALEGTAPASTVRGFPVFHGPAGHVITDEMVAEHRDG
ncbi:antitoxin [Cellulomonas sp. zg-ZUI222]|uniref:Antitoxin n=2 Tax=Cellulomonas TaxID=1707 RepID=A0ABY5K428_9CELL|nr:MULTISPECIES: antitoxin [Cellulomonas]MBO0899014.1 antitoxin [Cellulomonas sp. zg-ZUI22]MBO0919866.1 antitoxin [Cellulomonas wangleii]MBO0923703.1 antitoxin [Cellulomonas wangleii]MBO0923985.1 antitoxin [Cellulomonas wangleii]MCC2336091.1 antitoxin [Cellulomonas wangsupingiae]